MKIPRSVKRLAGSVLVAGCAVLIAAGAVHAGERAKPKLRVGTSGDYAPFSMAYGDRVAGSWTPQGLDIAVAQAYARDRGLEIEWVPFRWPDLRRDLAGGRFDVAMSGVTQRPERSLVGRYTIPVAIAGAVALVRDAGRFRELSDLDREGVVIGVNRGGHLERVTRERFPAAQIQAVAKNDAVPDLLIAGEVDAVITDTFEAPHWQLGHEHLERRGPFTRDTKSYLVRVDREDLARDLDIWLLEAEADGTLDHLRRSHLGRAARPRPASVLMALLASVDERLSLMPLVAASKAASGSLLTDSARETQVLDRAVARCIAEAHTLKTHAPAPAAIRAFFEAQIAAAKTLQQQMPTDAGPQPGASLDLVRDLRPALDRIGDRQAFLLNQLPRDLEAARVQKGTREALAFLGLPIGSIDAIADGIVAVAHAQTTVDEATLPRRVLDQ
jgi:cyclohexadienyl dehydratase